MNQRLATQIATAASAHLPPGEAVLATARGAALGATMRLHAALLPTLGLILVGTLTLPFTLPTVLLVDAGLALAGFLTFRALGRWRAPGAGLLHTSSSICLAATPRHLVVLLGNPRRAALWRVLEDAQIDDAVLYRALVGFGHGGVLRVQLVGGDEDLIVESPGELAIDDLARITDLIR